MTVYGDLYFLLNGGVDFVLLLAAGRLGQARSKLWRLALAAAAGAAYATVQLWFPGSWGFSLGGRVLASLGMVALAYAPVAPRRFVVLCVYLYAGAVFVAGATLAVSFAAAAGWGGGVARWSAGGGWGWGVIPWWALAAGLAGTLAIARTWAASRALRHPWLVGLQVGIGAAEARCTALVDTGNRLSDPLGSGPVLVVEAGVLAALLPPELAATLDDVGAVVRAADGTGWERRLRVIPFQTLGTDGGLLVGFRPDRVEVEGAAPATGAAPVTVGIAPRPLDPGGAYQALVPVCLLGDRGERRPVPQLRQGVNRGA